MLEADVNPSASPPPSSHTFKVTQIENTGPPSYPQDLQTAISHPRASWWELVNQLLPDGQRK